jgi:hypothetical protein
MSVATKLIEGVFNPEDAAEIVIALIDNKLKFHMLKAFSTAERDGLACEHSKTRIAALNEAKQEILEAIAAAKNKNCKLKIASTLNIELDD